jgi:hypothetical protein
MDKTVLRSGLAGLLALTAFQGNVSAQAAPEAPAPAPMAEPAATPAPEASPVAQAAVPAPMADAQPAEMGPMPEPTRTTDVTGWFRFDLDSGGLQLWAGATHPLGSISLASDIYVFGTMAELDLGLALTVADGLTMTPMVGYTFDFATQTSANLALPQLYTIYDGSSVYFESWIQVFFPTPFPGRSGELDYLHTRDFLLAKASDHFSLGLEVDANIALKNKLLNTKDKTLYFLPIGPHVKVHYGANSTLELFGGYDVMAKDQGKGKLAGRFTFVQTW